MPCCGKGKGKALRAAEAALAAMYVSDRKPKGACAACGAKVGRTVFRHGGIRLTAFRCSNGHYSPVK